MRRRRLSAEERTAIERLLWQGLSDRSVAARLSVHYTTVARIHKALGLPRCKPGHKSYPSLAEAFRARTESVDGGHLRWTGPFHAEGIPNFMHDGRHYSAYRIAFKLRTGREPAGHVRSVCDFPHCVEPRHVEDQTERQRNSGTLDAIFGGGA